jgi:hypothetical protein
MHISKGLAVAASGVCLAAAATIPAVAGASHQHRAPSVHTKQFPSTLKPNKGIKTGTKMVLKGHGALKNTQYTCVYTVLKGKNYWAASSTISGVMSNSKGKVKCVKTFAPYTGTITNKSGSHKCPLTKKDKKHHFRCAMDISTASKTSATNQYFKTK